LIVDTPPAQALTDALSVAALSSGVILVVESGKTNAHQAMMAIASIRDVGARVLGVVLNKAKDRQMASYYYYEQTAPDNVTSIPRPSESEAIAEPIAVAAEPSR
jgi:Mrp family chromosome partitioning ATPase